MKFHNSNGKDNLLTSNVIGHVLLVCYWLWQTYLWATNNFFQLQAHQLL